jgi:signal transduction histidine kinase
MTMNSDCASGTTERALMRRFLSSHGLEGHYGLRAMRERATLIKGKLAVWSEVNEGTEVELRVPASAAYTTDHKPSWLRKFAPKA